MTTEKSNQRTYKTDLENNNTLIGSVGFRTKHATDL